MGRFHLAMLIAVFLPSATAAQEPLAAARELYAAAAYEDALAMLNRATAGGPTVAGTEDDVLRAFCLLALQREDEARAVIRNVVLERPTYVPTDEEASPRIRAAFRDVRQRLLPDLVRRLYQSARESYERKEHLAAAAKFGDLLKLLDDPDVAGDATFADLRLLAEGFRAVSGAAAGSIATASSVVPAGPIGTSGNTSAGLPTSRPSAANRAPPAAPAASAAAEPAPLPALIPPVVISQQLPPWRPDPMNMRTGMDYTGAIELVIDEQGLVESVSLRESVHPRYDDELLRAAKTWKYQPARRGDQPIKFHKTLVVKLNNVR